MRLLSTGSSGSSGRGDATGASQAPAAAQLAAQHAAALSGGSGMGLSAGNPYDWLQYPHGGGGPRGSNAGLPASLATAGATTGTAAASGPGPETASSSDAAPGGLDSAAITAMLAHPLGLSHVSPLGMRLLSPHGLAPPQLLPTTGGGGSVAGGLAAPSTAAGTERHAASIQPASNAVPSSTHPSSTSASGGSAGPASSVTAGQLSAGPYGGAPTAAPTAAPASLGLQQPVVQQQSFFDGSSASNMAHNQLPSNGDFGMPAILSGTSTSSGLSQASLSQGAPAGYFGNGGGAGANRPNNGNPGGPSAAAAAAAAAASGMGFPYLSPHGFGMSGMHPAASVMNAQLNQLSQLNTLNQMNQMNQINQLAAVGMLPPWYTMGHLAVHSHQPLALQAAALQNAAWTPLGALGNQLLFDPSTGSLGGGSGAGNAGDMLLSPAMNSPWGQHRPSPNGLDFAHHSTASGTHSLGATPLASSALLSSTTEAMRSRAAGRPLDHALLLASLAGTTATSADMAVLGANSAAVAAAAAAASAASAGGGSDLSGAGLLMGGNGINSAGNVGVGGGGYVGDRTGGGAIGRDKHSREALQSKYRGVYWRSRAWVAQIQHHGRKHYLGTYVTEEAAAQAYDEAARKLHGSNAAVNFPRSSSETAAADTVAGTNASHPPSDHTPMMPAPMIDHADLRRSKRKRGRDDPSDGGSVGGAEGGGGGGAADGSGGILMTLQHTPNGDTTGEGGDLAAARAGVGGGASGASGAGLGAAVQPAPKRSRTDDASAHGGADDPTAALAPSGVL